MVVEEVEGEGEKVWIVPSLDDGLLLLLLLNLVMVVVKGKLLLQLQLLFAE